MILQGLDRWLTAESLPAWIAALIMLVGWAQQWYRGRTRPSKIVAFEANRTVFAKLEEAKKRLSIAFNGQEIETLAMIDLAVRNEGPTPIEEIEFTIELDEEARILAMEPQAGPPGITISTSYIEDGVNLNKGGSP